MPQEKIIIKFEPQGDKKLIDAINRLSVASGRLNGVSSKTTASTNAMGGAMLLGTRNSRLLGGAFATLRSKLLLATFAMGMFIKPLMKMAQEAAKVNSMGRAFDTLSGGVGKSKIAFDRLRAATNNTMTEMDLLKQANNAMILGVSKGSEEMAEMFDIAQRLGRALGQDTAMSVESLITGIGRQSRLMLDNIGIIVKADEAYESYAKKLGISTDSLTDAQKKQAFFNATMESAREKVSRLGDEQLTADDTFKQLATSSAELRKEFGRLLLPLITSMAERLSEMNIEVARFLRLLGGDAGTIDPFISFRESLPKDKAALQSLLAELESQLPKAVEPIEKITEEIVNQQSKVLTLAQFYENMGVSAGGAGADAAQQFRDIIEPMDAMRQNLRLIAETDIIAMELAAKSLGVEMENLPDIGDTFATISEIGLPLTEQADIVSILINKYKQAAEQQKNIAKANDDTAVSYEILGINMEDNIKLISQAASQYGAGTQLIIDASNDLGATIKDSVTPSMNEFGETMPTVDANTLAIIEKIRILKEAMEALRQGSNSTGTDFVGNLKKMGTATGSLSQSFAIMAQGNLDQTVMALQLGKAQGIMNIIVGATQAVKAKGFIGFIEGAAVMAQGMAMIANIDSQIASAKASAKMEQGGLIGGRRHSQGGTMIEAEQGEFVMSRSAVDSVGIENLNRMNEGGGGGSVTVNVSGNVLSQDFVEGELAENIKEAIRRGTDFGIS